jgi:spore germination protein GerM
VPQHTSADPQSGVVQGAAQSAVPIPAPPAAQPLEAKTKGGKVKVFFANTIKGKLGSCQDVFSVTRSVPQTPRVATAAISELIKGPTPEEAKAGFVSVVGRDTKLKSVEIKDGDAYVDFSALVFSGTVDKCSVVTMKSQIDSTLRQFVSIRFVRIMIDGKPWEEPVR